MLTFRCTRTRQLNSHYEKIHLFQRFAVDRYFSHQDAMIFMFPLLYSGPLPALSFKQLLN